MNSDIYPRVIPNWINGQERPAVSGDVFDKLSPHTGKKLYQAPRSIKQDIEQAVSAARMAQAIWADVPPVQRGMILYEFVTGMKTHKEMIAQTVAKETGKSIKDARGETEGAIALGLFYASEGQRLYGRTTTSSSSNRYAMTIRQPIGIAGLITAANTPVANVAWKIFPALICGNSVILKPAEDTPATAWIVGKIAMEAGLFPGVLNIVNGYGKEAGLALVENPGINLISFTGSTNVGRLIQRIAGERLIRTALELGGKNPLIVCEDADLNNAVKWVLLSAFSNAGQRCASSSRIIIFNSIYDRFRDMLVGKTLQLKIGPNDEHDLGPVINEKQLVTMLEAVHSATKRGADVLVGGYRLSDSDHKNGFYMSPTLIDHIDPHDELSQTELFGPIACLYRAKDFHEAMNLANDSPYGLTACIHTKNFDRGIQFTQKIQAGVAIVNAGTYGSEPHMPFGGLKQSGNGSREPGTEAVDIYSELKDIYLNVDPVRL